MTQSFLLSSFMVLEAENLGLAQRVFTCCSQLRLSLESCKPSALVFLRSCRAEHLPVASPGGLCFLREWWLVPRASGTRGAGEENHPFITLVWRLPRVTLIPFTSLVMRVSKPHPGPWRVTEPQPQWEKLQCHTAKG